MKRLKVCLVASVILNIITIVGFFAFKSYMTSTTIEGIAAITEAERGMLIKIHSDLVSGDQERIESLQKWLADCISNSEGLATSIREYSTK